MNNGNSVDKYIQTLYIYIIFRSHDTTQSDLKCDLVAIAVCVNKHFRINAHLSMRNQTTCAFGGLSRK